MLPPNTVFFISDLHLSAHNPEGFALFLQFLEGPARRAHQLYILGDLFDVWVGEDINTDFQKEVQKALRTLANTGVALFFMSGNRDFLVSPAFLKEAGCHKLTDPFLIDLHGIPTILTHGDQLCTQDLAYQRYRVIAQHPLMRKIFLSLPKQLRYRIGQKLRQKSQQYQKGQSLSSLDVTTESVEKWMVHHRVKQLIHGHVHKPYIHDLKLVGKHCKRVVLGDWHDTASMLTCSPSKVVLSTFCPQTGIQSQASYTLEDLTDPFPAT